MSARFDIGTENGRRGPSPCPNGSTEFGVAVEAIPEDPSQGRASAWCACGWGGPPREGPGQEVSLLAGDDLRTHLLDVDDFDRMKAALKVLVGRNVDLYLNDADYKAWLGAVARTALAWADAGAELRKLGAPVPKI